MCYFHTTLEFPQCHCTIPGSNLCQPCHEGFTEFFLVLTKKEKFKLVSYQCSKSSPMKDYYVSICCDNWFCRKIEMPINQLVVLEFLFYPLATFYPLSGNSFVSFHEQSTSWCMSSKAWSWTSRAWKFKWRRNSHLIFSVFLQV